MPVSSRTRHERMNYGHIQLFAGTACPDLAQAVAEHIGIELRGRDVIAFPNDNLFVQLHASARGQDCYVIQTTSVPVHRNLMELLILIQTLRLDSAARITAVVPYLGYSRQDRRVRSSRVPISAKVVADMMAKAGVSRVLTVDLHAEQIQGFFDVPVDNVYGSAILIDDIERQRYENLIVVSPDVGGVVRARAIAKRLDDADLAIIDKRRPRANVATVMNIIGDVEGKTCVLVDDIVDTAGTLCAAANALKERGAHKVAAYCTHPVLSGAAIDNITRSQLDELVVTDTIPLGEAARACGRIRQLSVAELLAETIRRVAFGESVSSLYVD